MSTSAMTTSAMSTSTPRLPRNFTFGTATASYQIEGAVHEDGRGISIWDTFSHTPGKVANGDTGDVACDHYHRYASDVELMSELGIDAYRFSIAWPRIQPLGSGAFNARGFAFYDRLVDELLANEITPMATLYHWDLPQPLEDLGGWTNRDVCERFVEYAVAVQDHLGDRVQTWLTHNEPWVVSMLGYAMGVHAPGRTETDGALAAAHHVLLSHGMAVRAMRESRHPDQKIGITLNLTHVSPASDSAEDRHAADLGMMFANTLFTDPVLAGRYPELARETYGHLSDFSFIQDGDLEITSTPIDHFGINYYTPQYAKAKPSDTPQETLQDLPLEDASPADCERTDMGWMVEADGLRRLLVWLHETYPGMPTIVITENGRACADVVENGQVHDPDRSRYITDHVAAVAQAVAEGVDVSGYYCWSLLDNFEWAEGYAKRFGLVHVDYETQRRTPKDSFYAYRQLVQQYRNG